jgi:hydroxyacylglutathione hydrolase
MLPTREDNYVYLVRNRRTGQAAVLDPSDAEPVLDAAKKLGWSLDLVVNTHHHHDHTDGNAGIKAATGARIIGPRAEAGKITGGLDHGLVDGDVVDFCGVDAAVIATPGHTAGHISFYLADQGALFAGDTLFALGCGRLFEGTPTEMWTSLSKFDSLPDSTLVYCGHEYTLANLGFALSIEPTNAALQERGDRIRTLRAHSDPTIPTTLGDERLTNPFLRCHLDEVKEGIGMAGCSDVEAFTEIRARKDVF